MKKHLQYLFLFLLLCMSQNIFAQFTTDSSQTFFVCQATGMQTGVRGFSDDNGGTYSFWVDKRAGNAGSAVYGQHLDSLGNPLWAVDGKLIEQAPAKEVWRMNAVRWNSGILVAWVQGTFGAGGDTLYANYYDLNGTPIWSQPTVVANKQSSLSIIYVNFDNLDIFPHDEGATITYGLTYSGGSGVFSYNRIDTLGAIYWALDSKVYTGGGYYYRCAYDNHNGFYIAATTGGLGAHIYVGHMDGQGNETIGSPVDISTVAGGRGNDLWKVICGADTSCYVVWDNNTPGDVNIAKIKPNGNLPWGGGGARPICTSQGYKAEVDVIIVGDTIYTIWDDPRPPAANYFVYMQMLDTAATPLWTPNGILLSNLGAYLPYPKLVSVGNDVVAAYVVNGSFRAQKIHPDSSLAWATNGVALVINNVPYYEDFILLNTGGTSVTSIWKESLENICASKIQANGILASVPVVVENTFDIYPNPASDRFVIALNEKTKGAIKIEMTDAFGRLVYTTKEMSSSTIEVNTSKFAAGLYYVRVIADGFQSTQKLMIR